MRPLVAAAVTSVLVVGAAPAQARIAAPSNVTPAGRLVLHAQPAAGGGRSALLMTTYTRQRRDAAMYVRLGDGTKLGGLTRLASGYASGQIAVGSNGTALAAWTVHGTYLRVAVANPGEGFGKVQTLSRARSIGLAAVAVTKSGRAVVVWTQRTSRTPTLLVAIREPGRRFGAAHKLGATLDDTDAAAAPDGTVVVTWLTTPEGPPPPPAPYTPTPALVFAATLGPTANAFAPATQLAAVNPRWFAPQAAGGPGGAAVIWTQSAERRVAFLGAGGMLAPAESLALQGAGDLALGIPASGPTMALWHTGRGNNVHIVGSSVVDTGPPPPGATFGPPVAVLDKGMRTGRPRAAATRDRIVSAWGEGARHEGRRVCIAVHTATMVSAESSCPRARLVDVNTVDVAASGGYGIVTWIQGRRGQGGLAKMVIWRR